MDHSHHGADVHHDVHHDIHYTLDTLLVKTKYINSWRRRHGIRTLRLANFAALLSSVSGRDKVYRFAQASIKFIVWFLTDVMESPASDKTVMKLNQAASGFSAGRRFIRIGHTPGAIKGTIDGLRTDTTEFGYRWSTFISRIFGVTFLHLDHVTWLASLGVVKIDMDRQGVRSSICAFTNTLFQIISDLTSMAFIERRRREILDVLVKNEVSSDSQKLVDELNQGASRYKNLSYNCIRNALDLPGQLNGIFKWQTVPQSVWTWLAFVSSTLGVWQSWPSKAE